MDTTSKAIAKRHDCGLPRRPRRLRTIAEERCIVEETLEPGASVPVVAQAHDVNANLLFSRKASPASPESALNELARLEHCHGNELLC